MDGPLTSVLISALNITTNWWLDMHIQTLENLISFIKKHNEQARDNCGKKKIFW